MRRIFIAIILLFLPFLVKAQDVPSFSGLSVGASFSFGTNVNRLGLHFSTYYTYGFAQGNMGMNGYWNIRSLALQKSSFEGQFGIGLELGFGRRDSLRNEFIGLGENNLEQLYGIGYTYMAYWDNQKTSQTAGMFDVNIANFRLLFENDLFGGGKGWRDRFRTGAFLLEFQYEKLRFGLSTVLWTGDYVGCKVVNNDSIYPARFGYRLQEGSTHGSRSLGLFSLQVKALLPYQQMPQLNIGVDSEKVRHVFQNKLIHDQPFLPKSWIKRKPHHIPMLQADGSQYLFRENQAIKPTSFYFNLGLNNFPFY